MAHLVSTLATREEKEAVESAAYRHGHSVASFIREALRRHLSVWRDDNVSLAMYDEVEIEIPSSPRYAKFALLLVGHMEECERKENCDFCRAFLIKCAPDLVLDSDRWVMADDHTIARLPRWPGEIGDGIVVIGGKCSACGSDTKHVTRDEHGDLYCAGCSA